MHATMAKRKLETGGQVSAAKALKMGKQELPAAPKKTAAVKAKEGAMNATAIANQSKAPASSTPATEGSQTETTTVQIITGSYERVLHGFAATIPRSLVTGQQDSSKEEAEKPKVDFTDTFLFNAHASAIRCGSTCTRCPLLLP
jgi:protein MAK11